ncbi:unnamed protein product [Caenorhabditis angaria]|uniref:Aldose 1-epimerase n=1 Tax=Caenorhabditis angaria TaxID=860376 RepID=A0A9P1IWS9_9PELO|nr:unnamed protein product [Caenorhabditis angaria]
MTTSEEFIEITNKQGLVAWLLPFGATLAKLTFPDKNGVAQDVILGFDSIKEFEKDTASIGKTVGRVANRIKNAEVQFDGKKYVLEKNNGPHFLHGGSNGIGNKLWEIVRHSSRSVSFSILVDEQMDGLPGNAKIDVTYTVNDRNQLIVEHYATCTSAGLIAITNHAYWNLDGSETVAEHILEVDANEYVEVDSTDCPTGAILSVRNTIYDFTSPRKLETLRDIDGVLNIDNDLVTSTQSTPKVSLRLFSEKSGIEVTIRSSYPTIHLYASKYLDTIGRGNEKYGQGKGLAIEPQFHSAAPNFDNFPDVSLRPGENYSHEIVYSLSTIN